MNNYPEKIIVNEGKIVEQGCSGTVYIRKDVVEDMLMNRMDFGAAFASARKKGLTVFRWRGKLYHTKRKEEMI